MDSNKEKYKINRTELEFDEIILKEDYNEEIDTELIKIISGFKKVNMGYSFNKPINSLFAEPNSIEILYLGPEFNLPVDCLQFGLKKLTLAGLFNLPIDNLPNSLEHLHLGRDFNQLVDNLPHSLEKLEFGVRFNSPINNLPSKLKKIFLGWDFNYSLDNLPNSITHIFLSHNFNTKINNLPSSLVQLKIDGSQYLLVPEKYINHVVVYHETNLEEI